MFCFFIGLLPNLPYLCIPLLCSTLPLITFHSTVPQPIALSLLLAPFIADKLSRPTVHFLATVPVTRGENSLCSFVPLTLHDNESVEYRLHISVEWRSLRPLPQWNPRSRNFLLYPNFSSDSQAYFVVLVGFAMLQVTTPCTILPSLNNSSFCSNFLYTLHKRSSSRYCMINLKLISLQYLAKCPYLSHSQHGVLVSSPLLVF